VIKVIPSGSFNFDEPMARLVELHSRGVDHSWMQKRAAVLTREIQSLRPEPGYSYIHLIDMGAQEAYGHNRNGDGFNEKAGNFELVEPKEGSRIIKLGGGLMEYHNPTFEKYAHVYKHHNNKDPKHAIGSVKAAAYNPDMRRGELIIRVPHDKEWEGDLQKLASGGDIPFSMACKVAYDICSYCGNRGRSRAEYCDHLKDHMTEVVKSGHSIFAINDKPAFFDISKVFRPADRIAWSLRKVAALDLGFIGGAELAEQLQLVEPVYISPDTVKSAEAPYKLAAAAKLAEIEKTVESVARGGDNPHLKQLAKGYPRESLKPSDISTLRKEKLGSVLAALGEAQVGLSLPDFFRLVMGEKYASIADSIPAAETMLPGMFNRLTSSGEIYECAGDRTYDASDTAISRSVRELVEKLASGHSLADGPVQRRLTLAIINGHQPVLKTADDQPEKQAAVLTKAAELCKEYAKYQISFARLSGNDSLSNKLTVLGNYLTF